MDAIDSRTTTVQESDLDVVDTRIEQQKEHVKELEKQHNKEFIKLEFMKSAAAGLLPEDMVSESALGDLEQRGWKFDWEQYGICRTCRQYEDIIDTWRTKVNRDGREIYETNANITRSDGQLPYIRLGMDSRIGTASITIAQRDTSLYHKISLTTDRKTGQIYSVFLNERNAKSQRLDILDGRLHAATIDQTTPNGTIQTLTSPLSQERIDSITKYLGFDPAKQVVDIEATKRNFFAELPKEDEKIDIMNTLVLRKEEPAVTQ